MCFDTWMQCVQANLSTSCSPVFKRQLVNLNITCFSLYLCVCRWFPALNGTLSTVSMRMVVSLSECVAPLPLRKKQQVWKLSKEIYTHACRHMLIVLYLETTLAPSHHPFSQTALQSACSLSLCSNGHLACYSLIYLWLSVIGQLYDWISLSYCCLLSLHAISLSPAVCFCEPLTYSHLFTDFILISVNPSLYLCSLLFNFSVTHKNCLLRSPNHTFSTFYLLLSLFTLSVCLTINYLMFYPTCSISCFSRCVTPFFQLFLNLLLFLLIFLRPFFFLFYSPTFSQTFSALLSLPLLSPSICLLSYSIPSSLSQTLSRVSTSSSTTCVLSAMPSESQRRSGHTAWSSALSMKTTLRWWSAMEELCCGSSKPTPPRLLPILGIHTHTHTSCRKR